MTAAREEGIKFRAGDLLLEGRLAQPAEAQQGVVVCHPHPQYGGSMDNNVVDAVTRHLQRNGIATFRFNFRGVGESEGGFGNLVGECDDARAAVQLLRERTGFANITLAGYSFGAIVALQAGHDHPNVERLIAIAPPFSMFDADFLRECQKPKLMVVGEHDSFCPPDLFERCVSTFPEPTEHAQLANADHFFVGQEAELAGIVTRFVLPS